LEEGRKGLVSSSKMKGGVRTLRNERKKRRGNFGGGLLPIETETLGRLEIGRLKL